MEKLTNKFLNRFIQQFLGVCKYIIICTTLLVWISHLHAQNIGKVFTHSYLPQDYNAETQNWCILQDSHGIIYVANGSCVLRYDGVSWEQIFLPNGAGAISLAISPKGKIYVGGIGEFGYLQPNDKGKIEYISLKSKIDNSSHKFGYIRTILVRSERDVIFKGDTHFFHLKDGQIRTWKDLPNLYHRSFLVDKEIYVRQQGIGLSRFTGEEFVTVRGGEFFADKTISVILPHISGNKLIGTRNAGFYLMNLKDNTGEITLFESEISQLQIEPYHGRLLQNGNYIFCGLNGGVFITDTKGKILQVLSEDIDLKATPYYAFEDQQGAVWLGLSKGILRAEINKAITFFGEEVGLRGMVNAILEVGKRVYVGTGEGFYYIENSQVHQIPNATEQTWFIKKIKLYNGDSTIIFGERKYIYELRPDGKPKIIHEFADGYSALNATVSQKHPDIVWIAHREGIGKLVLGSQIRYQEVAKTFETRHILEDWKGNLWLCSYQNGIIKVDFSESHDLDSIQLTEYNIEDGLPSLRYPFVFEANKHILFGFPEGLYEFNSKMNRFEPSDFLGKDLRQRSIFYAIEDQNQNVWITGMNNRESPLGVAKLVDQNRYKWYDTPLRRIPQMLENKIFLGNEKDQIIWVGGSEGLFRYEIQEEETDLLNDFYALISKITLNEDSVIFHGTHLEKIAENTFRVVANQPQNRQPIFEHYQNSLTFQYTATSYDYPEGNFYEHYLEGYDEHWSSWSSESKKEYTNLPAGKFIFRVRAKNIYGKESYETYYAFEIRPPWYLTNVAYLFYVFGVIISIWLSIVFYTKRLRRDKEKLEFIVEARTSEVKRKNDVLEQQKEELEQQKAQLGKALNNISALHDIGQKITASLELEQLVQTIYTNVNTLGDATIFGIGSYNPSLECIEFKGYIEDGQKHSYTSESLNDKRKFSVWCFLNQKEVIINDLKEGYQKYLNIKHYTPPTDAPQSLIYVPLVIDKNPVGVLTLQSYTQNAYKNLDITVLRSLASYVAIALENAKSYEVIKENNVKITDSIRYAKTIQNAILPSESEMYEAFDDYFVIFRPKDIVSGDFFWISHTPKRTLIAVVDCTGHGVPGAFMSMVGNDLLTEIVNQETKAVPFLMLEKLNKRIQEALRQKRGFNNDGMDVCLCLLENQREETVQVSFTGAKRPLYYFDIDQKELAQLRGDKKSVGGIQRKKRNFTNQTIFLQKGDLLYLSTDGIVDQPNLEGQKFGTPYFKSLLAENAIESLENQRKILEMALATHMGNAPQRDDMTVIGIQL